MVILDGGVEDCDHREQGDLGNWVMGVAASLWLGNVVPLYHLANRLAEIAWELLVDSQCLQGGGAIFFVSDNNTGTLTIDHSTLHHNPSAGFFTRPFPGIFFHSSGHPKVISSTIN